MTERVVIVGGPRCGKSWHARTLGLPVFCGDPRSTVKDPEASTTYLPEGLGFGSDASRWIVDNWLPMPGPWVLEGHVMARVLRKWLNGVMLEEPGVPPNHDWPVDKVIVFLEQRPELDLLPGQVTLHRTVMQQWAEICDYFEPITEYAGHESSFHGSGGVD
jgi:hypothetical protein